MKLKTDNAMAEAYKFKKCPACKEKMWFWQQLCESCFRTTITEFIKKLKKEI